MKTVIVDIETLPAVDAEMLAGIIEIAPPSNYKDEAKIQSYIEEKRVTAVQDINKESALNPLYGRVLCICTDDGKDKKEFIGDTEADALRDFDAYLSDEPFRLVTYNGRDFDIRYLDMRLRLNGLESPFKEQHLKAFDEAYHVDLYGKITNFGKVKGTYLKHDLKTVSGFLGFISNLEPMDGSDILRLFLNGEMDKIVTYCHEDVARTRLIAERLGYLRSWI